MVLRGVHQHKGRLMHDWQSYYERVGSTPNSLTKGVLEEYVSYRGVALDLGAGNLRDSAFLLESGFKRVIAIDREKPKAVPRMIEFHERDIADYQPAQNLLDLAISCNTLFFLPPEKAVELLKRVEAGLRKDGVCACNFLGQSDQWITSGMRGLYCFSDDQAECLRGMFDVIALDHHLGDAPDSAGNIKFWDTWTLIFRKRTAA